MRWDRIRNYLAKIRKSDMSEVFMNNLINSIVSELKQIEDKRIQVQIAGELVDEIRSMLQEVPKQKNNYRRQLLLMFHEAIKQNYAKALFNTNQINALTGIARLCNEEFVAREQYFEMDDIFCECGLDMMPDWE